MTKTIGWTTESGKEIEFVITSTTQMVDDINYADGYNLNVGREVYENGTLTLNVNGMKPMTTSLSIYTHATEVDGYTLEKNPKLAGLYIVANIPLAMTEDKAILLNATIAEVIEAGKTDEVKAYEAAQAAKTAEKETIWAQGIIEKAAKQDKPYTDAEIRTMTANYNNLYNDGGEGYVPTWVSQAEYDKAQRIINR